MANQLTGFFGGINYGNQLNQARAEAETRAMEKLRDFKLAAQKRDDVVQNQVRAEATDIMKSMATAGPDELPDLQRRIGYLRKTADPTMLPAEFLDGTYGSVITEQDAEQIVPGRQHSAGQLVPSDHSLGDPKAGADRLTKGGMRRVTGEEVAAFDAKRRQTASSLVGKVAVNDKTPFHIRAGYGSDGEMRKGEFKRDMHAGMLEILTNDGQQPARVGMMDDAVWDAAKNRLYVAGEAAGMTDKEMTAVVERFEDDRKRISEGNEADLERIDKQTSSLSRELGRMFGIDPGVLGSIDLLEDGDRALYNALMRRGLGQIVEGDKDIASIVYGLSIAAERYAESSGTPSAFPVAQLRTDRDYVEKPLGSYPDYAEDHLKNVPNSYYDEELDAVIHIDSQGRTAAILKGQKQIDDSTKTFIDTAEAIEKDTFMPEDVPDFREKKVKPAKTVSNPGGLLGGEEFSGPGKGTVEPVQVADDIVGGVADVLSTAAEYWKPENIRGRLNQAHNVGNDETKKSFISGLLGGS